MGCRVHHNIAVCHASSVIRLSLLTLTATLAFAQTSISVPASSDAGTEIPIAIVKGAKPGPTLAVIAGISGTAYGPVSGLQQLAANLNPAELSGTLILVPLANVPAFLARSIYLSPVDHKDLGRAFPGKPDGTLTERIAHALTTQVIAKADAVIIADAGGTNTMLTNHVFQYATSDPKLATQIASMAMAFGVSYIVNAKASPTSPEGVALAQSKPVLKVMCGGFGLNDSRTTDVITKGVLAMLNLQGMIKDSAGKTRSPVYFDSVSTIESSLTGYLTVYAQRGQSIRKGEALYGISGYLGKAPQMFNCPFDGIILSLTATPPISKGEPIAVIGMPRKDP